MEITGHALQQLFDDQITAALSRHVECDFGEVSYQHHLGNLESIAESRGIITSVYSNRRHIKFYIMTWLDDFDPRTCILIP
jgi:hypothetical protein